MSNLIGSITIPTVRQVRSVSLLEVDVDPLAERFMVTNRESGELLYHCIRSPSGVSKVIFPVQYSTSNDLMVVILDDDRTYNAAIADGVKLQLVDANTINMSQ